MISSGKRIPLVDSIFHHLFLKSGTLRMTHVAAAGCSLMRIQKLHRGMDHRWSTLGQLKVLSDAAPRR
jgi:hypothetical protein